MVVGVVAYGRHHIVLVPIDDMEPMPLGLIWYGRHETKPTYRHKVQSVGEYHSTRL
jgi:hypothetical protein